MGSSNVNLLARIGGDSSGFTRAIGEVNAALDAANRKAQATSSGFRAFGDQLSSIGNTLSVGVTLPVIALGAAVVNSAANMDSLKRGLIAVSGSAAEAERQFVGLKEVAKLPGLGLKEAVQGSINLQAIGNSAEQSQRILKVFGNALATVGRGREDLAESIRQLGQLGARGQVTADNLKPLIERIPQLATIIKEKFGAEALGDPAKVFKQLGVDSKQFIEVILTELGKLPMVTGGAKNAIENFKDTVDQTAARIGEKLLPAVEALLPKLENFIKAIADTADEFTKLSPEVQLAGLAFTAAAVAAGPLLVVAGSLVSAYTTVTAAFSGAGIAATALAPALGALVLAFQYGKDVQAIIEAFKEFRFQATALVGAGKEAKENLEFLFEQIKKGIPFSDQIGAAFRFLKTALDEVAAAATRPGTQFLLKTLELLSVTIEGVTGRSRSMEQAVKDNIGRQLEFGAAAQKAVLESNSLGESAKRLREQYTAGEGAQKSFTAATEAATNAEHKHREAKVLSVENEVKSLVLKERLAQLRKEEKDQIHDTVEALVKYKDAVGAANAALTEMRITETAPALGGAKAPTSVRNLPRPTGIPGLPTRSNDDILNEAQNRAAGKRNVGIVRENTKDALDVWKQAQAKMRQAVSTITTDFSRGIADIITNGGKIGELFEKLGKQIANTLIRTVIEGGINQVTKSLAGLLTSLGGVGAKVGVLFGGAANSAGTIFSAGSSSAGSVASAAGSIGSAGASAAGSASGSIGSSIAAANPATAIVTAVAGVVTALSSVVANFQFAAMNKSLDLIEHEVRYSQIHLLYILEKMNQYLPKLADIHQRLVEVIIDGVKIKGGGEGLTVNITVNGSMIGGPNVAAELSQMVVANLKLQGVRA